MSRIPIKSTRSSTPAPSAPERKDGTVTLGNALYEVNLALRALKVELRYDPVLLDRVEVWHKNSFHGLATKANLHLNSRTYNRSHNHERPDPI